MGEDGEWTAVAPLADLPEGKAIRVPQDGLDLLLIRDGERVFAMDNQCNHQGGPLHRGRVNLAASQPTVTCPIHGSIFWLSDGRVMRGPASRPQKVFDARIAGEVVEIRERAPKTEG